MMENNNLRSRIRRLEDRIVNVERTINLNQQNSRKNNLEFNGIPEDINQDDLKTTVVKIINALEIPCVDDDIEACHRLSSKLVPKPTIIRAKRNLIEKIVFNRKKLENVAATAELPPETRLFVNNNLCPHMKDLAFNCRILKKKEVIADTWSFNGILKIKMNDGEIIRISHEVDLYNLFSEFEDFTFDREFCSNATADIDMERYDDLSGYKH